MWKFHDSGTTTQKGITELCDCAVCDFSSSYIINLYMSFVYYHFIILISYRTHVAIEAINIFLSVTVSVADGMHTSLFSIFLFVHMCLYNDT